MASMWKGNPQRNPHGSTQRLGPLRGLCPPAVVSATEGLSFQPHCGPQCSDGTKGLDATPADASWCTSNGRDCESHVGQDHGQGEVEHQGAIYLLGKPNVGHKVQGSFQEHGEKGGCHQGLPATSPSDGSWDPIILDSPGRRQVEDFLTDQEKNDLRKLHGATMSSFIAASSARPVLETIPPCSHSGN